MKERDIRYYVGWGTTIVVSTVLFILLLDPFEFVYPARFKRKDVEDISSSMYKTYWPLAEDVINVHLIPHTHDDAGWQVSVDEYQLSQVDVILDNVFLQLEENPDRRFTYAETNFFAAWFRRQSASVQSRVRKLVTQGRLEIVNGGWVQHDEATPLFNEMIDQTTRGHLWLKKHLNVCPNVAWQLDPFGHSNTQAWLLSYKTGMDSVFFGRSDYRELNMRYRNSSLEYVWQSSKSFPEAKILAVQLFGQGKYGGYYSWYPFEETNAKDRNYVQDDMTMQDYNVKEWIDRIVSAAKHQASQTRTNHQLWMLGNDFTFQSASRWYTNYDKLIHYVNLDGRVRIVYSTPSEYVKAKHFYGKDWGVTRTSDLFPLADGPHEYWTGYFTSRPSLKRQYRYASALLTAARQLETLHKINFGKSKIIPLNDSARTPTSPVGIGWTDDLEGALAVVAHHDGITGTARQSVTNDYAHRLALGSRRAEFGAAQVLEKIARIIPGGSAGFCNCNSAGPRDCLANMSSCSHTSTSKAFSLVVWNSMSLNVSLLLDLPVVGSRYQVRAPNGTVIPSSVVEIDPHTKALPLLYLNDYNMTPSDIWHELSQLENQATHRLVFPAHVPAVGYSAFRVEPMKMLGEPATQAVEAEQLVLVDDFSQQPQPQASTTDNLENHIYRIDLHPFTKRISAITNKRTGRRIPFELEWAYYRSSVGGCTKEKPELDACLSQASGAYLFRPNETEVHWRSIRPTFTKVRRFAHGFGVEIVQKYATWISHTIRLDGSTDAVQVEWTVGPIPIEDGWGKEVVVRYRAQGLDSKDTFYTDSNGRETVMRIRDERSRDVCDPEEYAACKKSLKYEGVSSNYYPVNAFIALDDGKTELSVVVDATHGGTSMTSGSIELMTHRRVLHDDFRGVEEPLNETMCGCGDIHAPPGQMGAHGRLGDGGCNCPGLTVRGKHFLILDEIPQARVARRLLSARMAGLPQMAFYENDFINNTDVKGDSTLNSPIFSPAFSIPLNVQMLTFCSNYENGTLVRFSHAFEKDEHPKLSQEVSFALKNVFRARIKSAKEYSLSGNQPIEQLNAQHKERIWGTPVEETTEVRSNEQSLGFFSRIHATLALRDTDINTVVVLKPMEIRTYWVQFEER